MSDRNKTIECATLEGFPAALVAMRLELNGRILPEHAGKWDHVKVEIWPDSGRVIAYPAHSAKPRGVDRERIDIQCEELEERYYGIDSESDAAFDAALEALVSEVEEMISSAMSVADFRSVVWSSDDEEISVQQGVSAEK